MDAAYAFQAFDAIGKMTDAAPRAPAWALDLTAAGRTRMSASLLLPATLVIVSLGLLARIMSYPLEHDEQIHIAAGVMLSEYGLYRDLGYNHLPNLPWLLNGIFRLTGTEHFLLTGRLLIFLCWLATFGALTLIALRYARSTALAALAVLLLAANVLCLGQAGMIVSNNFIPIPFALMGLYLFLRGLDGPAPRPWPIAAAGLCLSIAIGFKANYLFLLPPFALAALLVPSTVPLPRRLIATVLPLLAGGVIGALPVLLYLLDDPGSFFAHTFRYFTHAHAEYWRALDVPKTIGFGQKLLLAEELWLSGTTLLAMCLALYLALASLFSSEDGGMRKLLSWRILLVLSLAALGVVVSLVPTPSFPQYFVPPIAFLIVLPLLLYGALDAPERRAAIPMLVAVALLALVAGASRLLADLPALGSPTKWTGWQVHDLGGRIAERVPSIDGRDKAATLSPIHALEGGLSLYPEFAAGPFLYRVVDLLPASDRRYFRATSEAGLPAFLDADPPSVIIVGLEGDLDRGLTAYAQARGFSEAELDDARTKDGTIRLYVRRGASEAVPRR